MDDEVRQKRSVVPGGPLQDAVRVKVLSESGEGILARLEDGTELRIKPSVIEAWRFLDSFDHNGFPNYQIQAALFTSTAKIDEKLKKP